MTDFTRTSVRVTNLHPDDRVMAPVAQGISATSDVACRVIGWPHIRLDGRVQVRLRDLRHNFGADTFVVVDPHTRLLRLSTDR